MEGLMGLFEKLCDTLISHGLSWLLKSGQIEQNGLAEARIQRKKMLLQAKTEIDIEKLKQGLIEVNDNGEIQPIENMDIIKLMLGDEREQIIKKKINLLDTTEKVFTLIKENPENKDFQSDNIDIDWFDRWREYAEKANTDEVQYIWARILNQEFRNNGSISLRTLDFIRNISKSEAVLIEKICSIAFNGSIIYHVSNKNAEWIDGSITLLDQIGINQMTLMELQYLGIIESVDSMGMIYELNSQSKDVYLIRMRLNDHIIIVKNNDSTAKIVYSGFPLTKLGRELRNILQLKTNMNYFNIIFDRMKKLGFEVEM
jgi:hypothetical protein